MACGCRPRGGPPNGGPPRGGRPDGHPEHDPGPGGRSPAGDERAARQRVPGAAVRPTPAGRAKVRPPPAVGDGLDTAGRYPPATTLPHLGPPRHRGAGPGGHGINRKGRLQRGLSLSKHFCSTGKL